MKSNKPPADPVIDWNAEAYARDARYVADLAADLIDLLAPQPGETILDLGCGDGGMTEKLAASGAHVIGVDASPDMIALARARGLDARQMDGQKLNFEASFDAVFSNAALHWMPDAEAVAAGVARALKPGGRFVAELGGAGNVAGIVAALEAVLREHRLDPAEGFTWYFPTPENHAALLRRHGFEMQDIRLFDRPTKVEMGMDGWLGMFGTPYLDRLPVEARGAAVATMVERLAETHRDDDGLWWADHVRLRFTARKP